MPSSTSIILLVAEEQHYSNILQDKLFEDFYFNQTEIKYKNKYESKNL